MSAPPGYSHAAAAPGGGRLVVTAGAVPLEAEGNLVGPEDLANLALVLGVWLLGYEDELVEIEAIAISGGGAAG